MCHLAQLANFMPTTSLQNSSFSYAYKFITNQGTFIAFRWDVFTSGTSFARRQHTETQGTSTRLFFTNRRHHPARGLERGQLDRVEGVQKGLGAARQGA